jgi:levanbiose-producing levanase
MIWLMLVQVVISATAGDSRPSYHLTSESEWLSDPQRPFYLGGEWHLYYLYNSNFDFTNPTGGGGTEWFHLTSQDLISWLPQGVAIEKYQPNADGVVLGDIETGSAIIDLNNTAGFGENAVVAILTQMQDGIQQQSLFYSTSNGYNFTPYSQNPVMPNPNVTAKLDFRDPKVIWDNTYSQWVMVLSEASKITFYASTNLTTWVYKSTFSPLDSGIDLGILECPDLYQLDVDGDTTKRTWVLASSANGYLYNRTTSAAYWTGTWDGSTFTASDIHPQWMDDGSDFYAAVTWPDSLSGNNGMYASRYATAWTNNWNYANDLPYYGNWAGQLGLVREIKLRNITGIVTMVSEPISLYTSLFGSSSRVHGTTITTDPTTASLPQMAGDAYVIRAVISKNDGDDGDEVQIRIKGDGTYATIVGYNFSSLQAFFIRDHDGVATDAMASGPKEAYNTARNSTVILPNNTVNLSLYVDWNSAEVFVNSGEKTLSGLIYPNLGASSVEMVSSNGQLLLDSFTYAGIS